MKRRLSLKLSVILIVGLLPATAAGAEEPLPRFSIVPEKSDLHFIATQNYAPVEGKFTKFSGDIAFDPKRPEACRVHVDVSLAGVSADYDELASTLVSPDWFDAIKFPKAVFEAASCETKPGEAGAFVAHGKLTLRDKTQPLDLAFTLARYDAKGASASGTAGLKRTAFGVGQGEWTDTSTVKDDVTIKFTIEATRKNQLP